MAESIRAEATEMMRTAIAEAEAESPPDLGLVFKNAYAEVPPSFEADLEELRRILGGDVG
jgi:TPP-dependent pyruvate/acetoin dehydrogenase alpha subunit